MNKSAMLLALMACAASAAEPRARNVILFLADAGGIPTINAASLYGYDAPQKLFIQRMPHIALMDTSAADAWVTDSAAGMSAIVTGRKTNNGVLSQSAETGEPLKTILEYAEEGGLSTGVVSNMPITDATTAACYAHVPYRGHYAEIFTQLLSPRFGDGPEVVIGGGLKGVLGVAPNAERDAKQAGYEWFRDVAAIPPGSRRAMAIFDDPFEAAPAVNLALDILSRNRKGYFLMVEWDAHTDNPKKGLENMVELDRVIRRTVERVGPDTLVIFAADHSFDLRVRSGKKGEPLLDAAPASDGKPGKPAARVENSHTGEEVLVAAKGPGAARVRGFISNADLFRIMLSAYGRTPPARSR